MAAALIGTSLHAQERDTYQSVRGTSSANRGGIAKPIDDSWWPFGRAERFETQVQDQVRTRPLAVTSNAPANASGESLGSGANRKDLASRLKQEFDVYLRRQEVCDRLKQIAEETGDTALEQQAELMAQRAWFVYQQKTSAMRLPGLLPMTEQDAANALLGKKDNESTKVAEAPIRSIRTTNHTLPGDGKE